jgi:hypothetical protein
MMQRRGLASEWATVEDTVVLAEGEFGIETDTNKVKLGNGETVWAQLEYITNDAFNELKYAQLNNDQTLTGINTFVPGATSESPVIVNGLTGQSADLQVWSVNNVEKVSLSSAGDITAQGALEANSLALTGGTVTNVPTPVSGSDAVNKTYVDDAIDGMSWKEAVKLLADTNVELTVPSGTLTIDGHPTLDSGDSGYRILLKGQTTPSENGIYAFAVDNNGYNLTRATDANTLAELSNASIYVEEGTVYGNSTWIQSTHYLDAFEDQVWIQSNGTNQITDGAGLLKTGNTLSVIGTANRISVTPDNVDIDANYEGQTSIIKLGTVTAGTWEATKVDVSHGGTGATDAPTARTNLGAAAIDSPTFTGTPAAPTATANTNTTQLATTAFVIGQAGSATPLINGTAAVGTATKFAREDHVHPTDTTRASLTNPTFTGIVTAQNYNIAVTTLASDSIALDFAGGTGLGYRASVAGDITFTGSNYAAGVIKTVVLTNGATIRNLTFPASWIFLGNKPTTLAASKTAVLTVTSVGTTEAACVVGWAVQN